MRPPPVPRDPLLGIRETGWARRFRFDALNRSDYPTIPNVAKRSNRQLLAQRITMR
jgi:hypothetical protein